MAAGCQAFHFASHGDLVAKTSSKPGAWPVPRQREAGKAWEAAKVEGAAAATRSRGHGAASVGRLQATLAATALRVVAVQRNSTEVETETRSLLISISAGPRWFMCINLRRTRPGTIACALYTADRKLWLVQRIRQVVGAGRGLVAIQLEQPMMPNGRGRVGAPEKIEDAPFLCPVLSAFVSV